MTKIYNLINNYYLLQNKNIKLEGVFIIPKFEYSIKIIDEIIESRKLLKTNYISISDIACFSKNLDSFNQGNFVIIFSPGITDIIQDNIKQPIDIYGAASIKYSFCEKVILGSEIIKISNEKYVLKPSKLISIIREKNNYIFSEKNAYLNNAQRILYEFSLTKMKQKFFVSNISRVISKQKKRSLQKVKIYGTLFYYENKYFLAENRIHLNEGRYLEINDNKFHSVLENNVYIENDKPDEDDVCLNCSLCKNDESSLGYSIYNICMVNIFRNNLVINISL